MATSKHKEIEIKFRVDDLNALERKLRRAGFRQVQPATHEMNTLYDLPGEPLRRRGELLRLRKYGSRWIVTHKAKAEAGRHKSRVEVETEVADGTRMAAILEALGYVPSFRYEKFRSHWTDRQGDVLLDHTPIGDLAEIEGRPRWIEATAAKLGVSPAQYITGTYADLFQEWKNRVGSKATEMMFPNLRRPGLKASPYARLRAEHPPARRAATLTPREPSGPRARSPKRRSKGRDQRTGRAAVSTQSR
jgi:adenylate cyclase class 2